MQREDNECPYSMLVYRKIRNLKKKLDKILSIEEKLKNGGTVSEDQLNLYSSKVHVEKSISDMEQIYKEVQEISSNQVDQWSKYKWDGAKPFLNKLIKILHIFSRYKYSTSKELPDNIKLFGKSLLGLNKSREVLFNDALNYSLQILFQYFQPNTPVLVQDSKIISDIIDNLSIEMENKSQNKDTKEMVVNVDVNNIIDEGVKQPRNRIKSNKNVGTATEVNQIDNSVAVSSSNIAPIIGDTIPESNTLAASNDTDVTGNNISRKNKRRKSRKEAVVPTSSSAVIATDTTTVSDSEPLSNILPASKPEVSVTTSVTDVAGDGIVINETKRHKNKRNKKNKAATVATDNTAVSATAPLNNIPPASKPEVSVATSVTDVAGDGIVINETKRHKNKRNKKNKAATVATDNTAVSATAPLSNIPPASKPEVSVITSVTDVAGDGIVINETKRHKNKRNKKNKAATVATDNTDVSATALLTSDAVSNRKDGIKTNNTSLSANNKENAQPLHLINGSRVINKK